MEKENKMPRTRKDIVSKPQVRRPRKNMSKHQEEKICNICGDLRKSKYITWRNAIICDDCNKVHKFTDGESNKLMSESNMLQKMLKL